MVLTPYPMGIHGVYDKKLFDKKALPPNNCVCFIHAYIRFCLLMRNQNTQQNMKHTSNTVVI